MRLQKYLGREEIMKVNLKFYALVMGQCTASLKSTLKGDQYFERKYKKIDVLWLFKMIKK